MKTFERNKLADCLMGQAHLCERMASDCADEEAAEKLKLLARQCLAAAGEELALKTKLEWPVVLAF